MEKQPHDAVSYGPGDPSGDHCAVCTNFQPGNPPQCSKVIDPISAGGWCELFAPAMANVASPGGL